MAGFADDETRTLSFSAETFDLSAGWALPSRKVPSARSRTSAHSRPVPRSNVSSAFFPPSERKYSSILDAITRSVSLNPYPVCPVTRSSPPSTVSGMSPLGSTRCRAPRDAPTAPRRTRQNSVMLSIRALSRALLRGRVEEEANLSFVTALQISS